MRCPADTSSRGESFVEAVIREMKEETGLTVIAPKLVGVKQFPIENGRYVVFLFKAEKYEGELTSSDEGQMEWVDYDRIDSIDAVADLKKLIDMMNAEGPCEFQYVEENGGWRAIIR